VVEVVVELTVQLLLLIVEGQEAVVLVTTTLLHLVVLEIRLQQHRLKETQEGLLLQVRLPPLMAAQAAVGLVKLEVMEHQVQVEQVEQGLLLLYRVLA
jgi:hypothetical protein